VSGVNPDVLVDFSVGDILGVPIAAVGGILVLLLTALSEERRIESLDRRSR
jgi:hypothetical protein